MYSLESKKLLILRILTILEQHSDSEHPLKYTDIMDLLKTEYSAECERKAVGRNISFLKEGGYSIVSTKKGVYLENRIFENSELKLLIDSVLASRHINDKHSGQIIEKLRRLGGIYFDKRYRNLKISDWDKSPNISFFLNIELIDEAIERGRQIEFTYNCYGIDKKLHPKECTYVVNPYHMLLHNQRYYLISNVDTHENISNFRIDRITDIKILNTSIRPVLDLPDIKEEVNLAKIASEQPYMYTGVTDYIEMEMDKSLIGDIVDWFGEDFIVEELENDRIRVRLKANLSAMRYWALQYGTNVEIVEPLCLKEQIIKDIRKMALKYKVI